MKLHNKKSYLTSQNEGLAKKRLLPRFTQLLYILFIVFIFAYLIYFFAARTWLIQEIGVVEVDKQRVSATNGGKISALYVQQGDKFKRGDRIATIAAAKYCRPIEVNPQIGRLNFDLKDEELVLKGLYLELTVLKKRRGLESASNSGIRRALEVSSPLLKESFVSEEAILKAKNAIDLQQIRIDNLRQRLALLQSTQQLVNNDPSCAAETIYATFDGYVFSQTKQQNEVTTRGETFLTIVANDAAVFVEVHLENDLFDSAQANESFTIEFPDGVESSAVVSSINSSAISQSERAWNNYSPVIPKLIVNLEPSNKADALHWKQFDRYQVNIKGVK